MTKIDEIYKCEICGNIIEMIHSGVGELVCCGQPMKLMKEKFVEEGNEKHLPVIEEKDEKTIVTVGEIKHPMEENHYIEWVELIVDGKVYRQKLAPGQKPSVEFCITGKDVKAREYCNVHGLWKK